MPNNEDIFGKKNKHISREAHNYNYKQNYHTKSQKSYISEYTVFIIYIVVASLTYSSS